MMLTNARLFVGRKVLACARSGLSFPPLPPFVGSLQFLSSLDRPICQLASQLASAQGLRVERLLLPCFTGLLLAFEREVYHHIISEVDIVGAGKGGVTVISKRGGRGGFFDGPTLSPYSGFQHWSA